MSDWQPIETKPKTSCLVVLYHPTVEIDGSRAELFSIGEFEPCPTVAFGYAEKCCEGSFDYDYEEMPEPTHWMPLPEPPVRRK